MRKARLLTAALALAGCSLTAAAQLPSQHTLWPQRTIAVNPAASANATTLEGILGYRGQWRGIEGAPTTLTAAAVVPVSYVRGGVGLSFEEDRLGLTAASLARVSLAWRPLVRRDWAVSIGAAASWRNIRLDGSAVRTPGGTYADGQLPIHAEPGLPTGSVASTSLGVDLGAEAVWREVRLGIAVLNANEPVTEWSGVGLVAPRTYTAYAAGRFPVAEAIDLEAGVIAAAAAGSLQAQANLTAWYAGNIGVGAAFRGRDAATVESASLVLAWRPGTSVTFGYAFDFGLSELRGAHDGSHEVGLRYVFPRPIGEGRLPPVIYNPRP